MFYLVTDFLGKMITRVFGSANERMLRSMSPVVEEVCALEPDMNRLSDKELKELTPKFRRRLEQGETLEDIHIVVLVIDGRMGSEFHHAWASSANCFLASVRNCFRSTGSVPY